MQHRKPKVVPEHPVTRKQLRERLRVVSATKKIASEHKDKRILELCDAMDEAVYIPDQK